MCPVAHQSRACHWLKMACCGTIVAAGIAVFVLLVTASPTSRPSSAPLNVSGPAKEEPEEDERCQSNLVCLRPSECLEETMDIVYACAEGKICCTPTLIDKAKGTPDARTLKRLLIPEECGPINLGNRIAGGDNASLGQYPWMALLGYVTKAINITQYLCGGFVINDRYIMTAAHCTNIKNLKLTSVKLGEVDLSKDIDCEYHTGQKVCGDAPIEKQIELVIPHPEFNRTTLKNDIALLRLADNIKTFTEYVQPICLPFDKIFKGNYLISRRLEVAGWGKTSADTYAGSSILQFTSVNGVNQTKCNAVLPKNVRPLSPKQICVIGKGNQEACKGDSGGPLMDRAAVADGEVRSFAVGVVSFKSFDTCGSEKTPSVFTRIDEYLDWILDTINV